MTHTARRAGWPLTLVTTSAAIAAGLTGCASDDNARLVLGDDVALASLPPMVNEPKLDSQGNPAPRQAPENDTPSVRGLDRSNFETTSYSVPIDGTRHQPEATSLLRMTDETARQRGEFPTARTALDQTSADNSRTIALEMLIAPAWAAIDFLITPVQLVIDPLFETVASPDVISGRTPHTDRAGAPGVLPLTRAELDAKIEEAELNQGSASTTEPTTGPTTDG